MSVGDWMNTVKVILIQFGRQQSKWGLTTGNIRLYNNYDSNKNG